MRNDEKSSTLGASDIASITEIIRLEIACPAHNIIMEFSHRGILDFQGGIAGISPRSSSSSDYLTVT